MIWILIKAAIFFSPIAHIPFKPIEKIGVVVMAIPVFDIARHEKALEFLYPLITNVKRHIWPTHICIVANIAIANSKDGHDLRKRKKCSLKTNSSSIDIALILNA